MNVPPPGPAHLPKWKQRVALIDGASEPRHLITILIIPDGVGATIRGQRLHTTYHVDGRRHVTGPRERVDDLGRRLYPSQNPSYEVELARLVGARELQVFRLSAIPLYFGNESPFQVMRKRSRPGSWLLDLQRLQPDAAYQVVAGIVGSGGRDALQQHIADLTRGGNWVFEHAEIGTQPSPTPYLVLLRSTLESPQGASRWASSSDSSTLRDGQPFTFYPPPEHRMPPGQEREPAVWPPAICQHSARVTYEYLPDSEASEPFVTIPATGMRLAVAWHEPGDPSRFELFVNPRNCKTTADGGMLWRFPSMRPAACYRMRYGMAGNAECAYVSEDGRTFYIRCRNLEWRRDGEREVSKYHLEVQW
jgi:hypothetical protein